MAGSHNRRRREIHVEQVCARYLQNKKLESEEKAKLTAAAVVECSKWMDADERGSKVLTFLVANVPATAKPEPDTSKDVTNSDAKPATAKPRRNRKTKRE